MQCSPCQTAEASDTKLIRHPDRYADERGTAMRDTERDLRATAPDLRADALRASATRPEPPRAPGTSYFPPDGWDLTRCGPSRRRRTSRPGLTARRQRALAEPVPASGPGSGAG